jgi:hypothetical protein
VHALDDLSKDGRAAVLALIAVDTGNDGVIKVHLLHRLLHTARLVPVEAVLRASRLYGAEAAGAGADVAQNHKRGGAAAPAFAHVGAVGALADRMQVVVLYGFADVFVRLALWERDAEPFGALAAFVFVRILDDRQFHKAGVAVAGGADGVGLHGAQVGIAGKSGGVGRRLRIAGLG